MKGGRSVTRRSALAAEPDRSGPAAPHRTGIAAVPGLRHIGRGSDGPGPGAALTPPPAALADPTSPAWTNGSCGRLSAPAPAPSGAAE